MQTIGAVANHPGRSARPRRLHPLPIRVMHWLNAIAMFIMIGSGWKIYNDEVIFGWLHFPEALTIGHWAQHGLQWHFLGMWIVAINGACLPHLRTGHWAFQTDAIADLLA